MFQPIETEYVRFLSSPFFLFFFSTLPVSIFSLKKKNDATFDVKRDFRTVFFSFFHAVRVIKHERIY